jgi:hypothetical protein
MQLKIYDIRKKIVRRSETENRRSKDGSVVKLVGQDQEWRFELEGGVVGELGMEGDVLIACG